VKKRILVIEDDPHLAEGLEINLELEGYQPLMADTGREGLGLWRRGGVDLILLDVMLPDLDGFEVCRRVREAGDRVPILFLTARGADADRIRGLEQGADDYIGKPFNLRELLARIKGIFRREEWLREQPCPDRFLLEDNAVDLRVMTVRNPRGDHQLREKEAAILRLLAQRQPEPVERTTILDRVWGYDSYPTTRTVDNFILSLRKILEADPAHPRLILTVHGVGYRLAAAPAPRD
jgi:two-component system alkaline phosphatase synthesis response regulator PhoP